MILKYILNLRYLEYQEAPKDKAQIVELFRLFIKQLTCKTDFQTPPLTCGEGLTISYFRTHNNNCQHKDKYAVY
jgi:hypothetical protein